MFGYSWGPILIILVIVLLLFGPKRLPELGESIGRAIRSFKKAHDDGPESLPPKEGEAKQPPAGESAAQAKACPQCHQGLAGDFAFCPHCGHKLKG
ncbi:MAG: twin-arginine translocase TatA/TatE family subunit [Deltaproteobacteria bacterium]|nr:twin-arginine translocase TatA/TatE family subunit [Deltaproteobacteria bacterium]